MVDLKALAERVIALVNGGRWEIDTFYSWRDDAPSAVLDLIADRDQLQETVDLIQTDLREIMSALGMSLHARPDSPHEVVQREVIPEVVRLKGRIEKATALHGIRIDPDDEFMRCECGSIVIPCATVRALISDDLPGMWEESDLSGGWADTQRCDCGKLMTRIFAEHGGEVHITTEPLLIPTPYEDRAMTCAHGVLWHVQPTTDQIAQWAKEG